MAHLQGGKCVYYYRKIKIAYQTTSTLKLSNLRTIAIGSIVLRRKRYPISHLLVYISHDSGRARSLPPRLSSLVGMKSQFLAIYGTVLIGWSHYKEGDCSRI